MRAAAVGGAGALALRGAGSARASETSERTSYTIETGSANEQTVHVYRSGVAGPTTLVVGGVHGDERAGYQAADEIATWTVDCGTLVVIPHAHPTAIADDVRPWDDDLNRQFPPTGGDCKTALASAIWNEVERHDPDWAFDLHSSHGIYQSGDGGVGQAMFPTWTSPARSTGEETVAALNDEFGLTGDLAYRMGNTLDADRDMLMHRVAGILDRPGYICETTEKAPLDDQVAWHLFTVRFTMAQYGQQCSTDATTASGGNLSSVEARSLAV
ncbi:MAG: succinylglutamate desuccinylase/aspartoacylase family protein, partial [Haloarculaceae archaeon]